MKKALLFLILILAISDFLFPQTMVYKYGQTNRNETTYIVNGNKVICYGMLPCLDSLRIDKNKKVKLREHYEINCYDYKKGTMCDLIMFKDTREILMSRNWTSIEKFNNAKSPNPILQTAKDCQSSYKNSKAL